MLCVGMQEPIDYGDLEKSIHEATISKGLEDIDRFIKKCIQLYETTVVRHGLMLVGPAISGKTKCYQVWPPVGRASLFHMWCSSSP